MKNRKSWATVFILPLTLMSIAVVTPAYSNTFHGINTPLNRNVGSAPNPTALDIKNDRRRLDYHRGYLRELARAIHDGADVRGYHAWSLMDNFEWEEGFRQRFGLVYVDFKTQQRIVKESGQWYGRVAGENALPAEPGAG